MKKLTQCLLSTLMTGGVVCSGLVQPVVAETIHDSEPYVGRPFVVDKILFDKNDIGVHYTGVGTDTKTNYLNVFWTDFNEMTEAEADILMTEAGTTTPEGMINFFQKKAELSPNTASTFYIYRYTNQGTRSLWDVPGVLYYTVRLADGTFLKGKADYRDCLSNPYFVEKKEAGYGSGLYCKLESFGDDRETYYWPYHIDMGRLGDVSEPVDPLDEEEVDDEGEGDGEGGEEGVGDDGGLGDETSDEGGEVDEPIDGDGGEEAEEPVGDEPKEQENVVPKTPNTGFGPRV